MKPFATQKMNETLKDSRKSNKKGMVPRNIPKKLNDSTEFTDGFYKPEYMQPPIVDTMKVKAGVKLNCAGQQKHGPSAQRDAQRMRRQDYIRLTEWGEGVPADD